MFSVFSPSFQLSIVQFSQPKQEKEETQNQYRTRITIVDMKIKLKPNE